MSEALDAASLAGAAAGWSRMRAGWPGRCARAWRRVSRRQWLFACGVGAAFAFGHSLFYSVRILTEPKGLVVPWLLQLLRWTPLLVAAACLLLFGLTLVQQLERERPVRLRHYIVVIVVVAAVCASVIDPALVLVRRSIVLSLGLTGADHSALPLPSHLRRSLVNALPVTLIMLSMWSLLWVHFHAALRTAQALAAAQLRLADVERTVLAEQLQSAQAMVEPAFLFDTLTLIEHEFVRDPEGAHRLLDALIRYLRAALPASDESGCTLGQQAELVRAYLEIERMRSGDRLGIAVELPAELQDRPFAPLLVLPLAVNAVRHGVAPAQAGAVTVRAGTQDDRLVIQVDDDGSGRCAGIREGAGLAGVRERLAALYGGRARLTLFDRLPRGISARIELPQGERA